MSTTEEQVKMARQIRSYYLAMAGGLAKVLIHADDLEEQDRAWVCNLLEVVDDAERTNNLATDLFMDGYDDDAKGLLRRVGELLKEMDEVVEVHGSDY